jgi:hypothetical protein
MLIQRVANTVYVFPTLRDTTIQCAAVLGNTWVFCASNDSYWFIPGTVTAEDF